MAENRNCTPDTSFKEAVCIDAGRVYDSCCDRDYIEDVRCYFSGDNQILINTALSVRLRSAEVINTYIDVEPVNFNKGYYSCDLTFFFLLSFDVYTPLGTCRTDVPAYAFYNKRVILYGSCGNVKTFANSQSTPCNGVNTTTADTNNPRCVVQVVDPVPLSANIGTVTAPYQGPFFQPENLDELIGGAPANTNDIGTPAVYATLGLFSIIQLVRNVQMLVPVYDFCYPEKKGDCETEAPGDAFSKLEFPTADFFPTKSACNCGNQDR